MSAELSIEILFDKMYIKSVLKIRTVRLIGLGRCAREKFNKKKYIIRRKLWIT